MNGSELCATIEDDRVPDVDANRDMRRSIVFKDAANICGSICSSEVPEARSTFSEHTKPAESYSALQPRKNARFTGILRDLRIERVSWIEVHQRSDPNPDRSFVNLVKVSSRHIDAKFERPRLCGSTNRRHRHNA